MEKKRRDSIDDYWEETVRGGGERVMVNAWMCVHGCYMRCMLVVCVCVRVCEWCVCVSRCFLSCSVVDADGW